MESSIGIIHAPTIALILVFLTVIIVETLCSEVLLEKGTTGMLPCQVQGTPFYVEWKKGSTDVSNAPLIICILEDGECTKQGSDLIQYDITSNFALLINDVEIIHEDDYFCIVNDVNGSVIAQNQINVTVFVHSTLNFTWESTRVDSSTITAKCDAIGARPVVSISWFINGQEITEGITETTSENQKDSDLADTFSKLTYPPATDHTSISCETRGHALKSNQSYTKNLSAPTGVTIDISTDGSTVTCKIPPGEEGNPPASYYQITGDAIKHESFTGLNSASADTEFTCVAGNYIGNVTATANLIDVLANQSTSGGFLASSWPPITAIQHTVSPSGWIAGIAVSAGLFATSLIINVIQYYGRNRKPARY